MTTGYIFREDKKYRDDFIPALVRNITMGGASTPAMWRNSQFNKVPIYQFQDYYFTLRTFTHIHLTHYPILELHILSNTFSKLYATYLY